MSRFACTDYDETFPNEGEFWRHNANLALKGKRGRKALAELREALLHLPERRLIAGALSTPSVRAVYTAQGEGSYRYWAREAAVALVEREGEGVCAVGAYCWWKEVQKGVDPYEAMVALPATADVLTGDALDTVRAGEDAGLTSYVAWILGVLNDETLRTCAPEERWERVLAWIDKELAEAPPSPCKQGSDGC